MIPKEDALKLEKIQNKCVQLIEPRKPIKQDLQRQQHLKLESLIRMENAKTWHKYYDNNLPCETNGNDEGRS